jgi:hypothetical protein
MIPSHLDEDIKADNRQSRNPKKMSQIFDPLVLFAVLLAGEKLSRLRLTGLTLTLGGAVLIGL